MALFEEELEIWGNVLVLAASLALLAKASDLTINNSIKVADVTRAFMNNKNSLVNGVPFGH